MKNGELWSKRVIARSVATKQSFQKMRLSAFAKASAGFLRSFSEGELRPSGLAMTANLRTYKLLVILVGLLFFNVASAFAQMTVDEALSKFVAAGFNYKNGQYDEAVNQYSKIIDGGQLSGPLYYNLGNSYFRNGESGKAVLNYERAKRLMPRDSDLNFNDRYVRSRIDSYGVDEELNLIDRAMKNYIQFYTTDEMVLIITGVVFAIGIVFLLSLYMNWPGSSRQGIIALLTLILLIYATGLVTKVQHEKGLAVIVTGTDSYFEPRTDSTVHFKLPEGTKARILKSEGVWIKVQRLDGKVGWVSRDMLEKI